MACLRHAACLDQPDGGAGVGLAVLADCSLPLGSCHPVSTSDVQQRSQVYGLIAEAVPLAGLCGVQLRANGWLHRAPEPSASEVRGAEHLPSQQLLCLPCRCLGSRRRAARAPARTGRTCCRSRPTPPAASWTPRRTMRCAVHGVNRGSVTSACRDKSYVYLLCNSVHLKCSNVPVPHTHARACLKCLRPRVHRYAGELTRLPWVPLCDGRH